MLDVSHLGLLLAFLSVSQIIKILQSIMQSSLRAMFRLMIFKKNMLICRELCNFTLCGSKQVGDEWAQACYKKLLFFAKLTFIPAVLFCCIPLWNSFYRATQKAIWRNGLSPDKTLLCVHRPLSPLTDPTPHKCSFFCPQ